jgi:hypothetical protein
MRSEPVRGHDEKTTAREGRTDEADDQVHDSGATAD